MFGAKKIYYKKCIITIVKNLLRNVLKCFNGNFVIFVCIGSNNMPHLTANNDNFF